MRLPRKIIGFLVVVVVAGAAGYGIYYRLDTSGENAATTESANTGPAPAVSADSTFSTDLPIPVEGAEVIAGDLVLEVRASGQAAPTRGTIVRSNHASNHLALAGTLPKDRERLLAALDAVLEHPERAAFRPEWARGL